MYRKLLLILAGIALICLALLACASTKNQYVAELVVPFDTSYWKQMSRASGIAFCDMKNNPLILYNQRDVLRKTFKYTKSHEWKHVRQMRNYPGGCKKFVKLYNDTTSQAAEFRFKIESEAFCASLEVATNEGENRGVFFAQIVSDLHSFYFPSLSYEQIEKKMPCSKEVPNDRTRYDTSPPSARPLLREVWEGSGVSRYPR